MALERTRSDRRGGERQEPSDGVKSSHCPKEGVLQEPCGVQS